MLRTRVLERDATIYCSQIMTRMSDGSLEKAAKAVKGVCYFGTTEVNFERESRAEYSVGVVLFVNRRSTSFVCDSRQRFGMLTGASKLSVLRLEERGEVEVQN